MRKTVSSTKTGPKQTTKSLSLNEREELARNEAVIERGFQTFLEVGTALLEIKKKALHRETHTNFEDYCRERFEMSRVHAHRQIRAVEVCALLPNGDTPRPTTEAQLRPLTSVPSDKARILWLKAVNQANGRKVTGSVVRRVVNQWKQQVGPVGSFEKAQWQELCLKYLTAMKSHILEDDRSKILEGLDRIRLLVEQIAGKRRRRCSKHKSGKDAFKESRFQNGSAALKASRPAHNLLLHSRESTSIHQTSDEFRNRCQSHPNQDVARRAAKPPNTALTKPESLVPPFR
jgi:hypothetical protein